MQLVDRVFRTIEELSGETSGLSIIELSERLDLPVSTIHRILQSLKDNNYVIQNPKTKRYELSYKIYNICSRMERNNSLITIARPYMERLSIAINKTITLCVLYGDYILNLDCIENNDATVCSVKKGTQYPLYVTSAGRVFLANMPQDKMKSILDESEIKKTTMYTKIEIDALTDEIADVKRKGYSIIDEEFQLGIQGASCPIIDSVGNAVAAIGFTTIKRKNCITKDTIIKLKETAEEISKALL